MGWNTKILHNAILQLGNPPLQWWFQQTKMNPQYQWLFWVSKWSTFGTFVKLHTKMDQSYRLIEWSYTHRPFYPLVYYSASVPLKPLKLLVHFLSRSALQWGSDICIQLCKNEVSSRDKNTICKPSISFFLNWKLELVTKCIDTHSFLV